VIAPAHALTMLASKLEPGERVLYARRPDISVTLRNKLVLWWIGVPWCIGIFGLYFAGRASTTIMVPFALVGLAIVIAPILLAIDTQYTLYALTDRRALIVHDWFRPQTVSCPFERMDEKPELLTAGGKGGHLYFASGFPPRLRDVDYTGKLAFRDLADVPDAAEALQRARKERPSQHPQAS
jgi:hypothetical protein